MKARNTFTLGMQKHAWEILSNNWNSLNQNSIDESINAIKEHYAYRYSTEDKKNLINEMLESKMAHILKELETEANIEDEELRRINILNRIFPEAGLIFKLKLIQAESEKIIMLDEYLKNELEINPFNAAEFVDSNGKFPELIKFYIQHNSCTTTHLINIFEKCWVRKYASLCLEQEKFTNEDQSGEWKDLYQNTLGIEYRCNKSCCKH